MTGLMYGDAVVYAARAMIGVPFVHAGRSVHGVDCIGLLVVAAAAVGVCVYDNRSYSRTVDADYMVSELSKACDPVPFPAALPGDVLLFRVGTSVQHMALVTESGPDGPVRIVHCYQTAGRVVEHALDRHWERRLAGAYRLRGVTWRP